MKTFVTRYRSRLVRINLQTIWMVRSAYGMKSKVEKEIHFFFIFWNISFLINRTEKKLVLVLVLLTAE